jgi:hypothetical protein
MSFADPKVDTSINKCGFGLAIFAYVHVYIVPRVVAV